jgi:hypothetical protein
MAVAIFLTGDLLRECTLSSRTSAFDQERRLRRLTRLVATTHLSRRNWGISTDGRGRVESDSLMKTKTHFAFRVATGPSADLTVEGSTWERNTSARQRFLSEHPQEEPKGVRAWNCRITAASIPGIEIANEVHPSGTQ